MRYDIYRRLRQTDGFVSGEMISLKLGVTRAALWKHIKAMRADGAVIESVTGRGYRLAAAPAVPRAEYVRAHLRHDLPVFFEESAASTNDTAKAAARDAALDGAVFIAGQQTAGKGRKGRTWVSAPGQGVYLTLLVRPKLSPDKIPGITLMAAVAVCAAIEQTSGKAARIKWPNDVIVGGKKVAGILTESMMHMDGVEFVACGIGVNTGARRGLPETAGALTANNTLLAAAVIDGFLDAYAVFATDGVSAFMPAFRARSAITGAVTLTGAQGSVSGALLGFDDEGAILIESGGAARRFIAGEVSLRGENGYV